MKFDENKVDDATLALISLVMEKDKYGVGSVSVART